MFLLWCLSFQTIMIIYTTYQSIASSKPSPFVTDVLNIDQVLVLRDDSSNVSDTSVAVIAPSISSNLAMLEDMLKDFS